MSVGAILVPETPQDAEERTSAIAAHRQTTGGQAFLKIKTVASSVQSHSLSRQGVCAPSLSRIKTKDQRLQIILPMYNN